MILPFKKQLNYLLLFGIMLFSSGALYAQQGTVTGTVKDFNGDPIIGANVFLEGTTQGTVSDLDGYFSLPGLPSGSVSISVSFVGYLTATQTIQLAEGGTSEMNFTVLEDLQQLSEVVVIGYGTAKKSDLTGAISSVDTEELNKLATTNVQQAIQGRVAGVMVTSASGAPGDNVSVRIRGASTVNNSDPLYVVDGFPSGSIDYLNPSDIESMEVLKDASATAIYGNRGAAGVILITTKKGSSKEASINFNTYYGTQTANKTIDVLNAMEYGQAKITAYQNAADVRGRVNTFVAGNPLYDTIQWVNANNYEGTNWQDEVLRQGTIQNYELSASGGSDKYTYNVSGSFNREDGIILESWRKRYLFRYAGTAELNKSIKSNFSLSYRNTEQTNYDRDLYGQGVLPNALVGDPISPVYLRNTTSYAPVDISQTFNPIAAAERSKNNKSNADQLVGNVGVDIKIIEGLVFSSKFGFDQNWNRTKRYLPLYSIGAKDLQSRSSLDEIYQRTFGWNNSNYINYNKQAGKHNINLMVGQEWSAFENSRLRFVVYDVPDNPALYYPHFEQSIIPPGEDVIYPSFNGDRSQYNRPYLKTKISSVFGRVFYGYDDRYLITVNFRRDAASQIEKDAQWGTFPSASVGWNLKNESFMKDNVLFSSLKLRGGWGKTGNIGSLFDPYVLYAVVTQGLDMVGEGNVALPGGIQTVNPNPLLQWEEVEQINAALDFGLLANRLTGSIDVFTKTTSGMIVIIDPPLFAGSLASAGNFGEMKGKGIELSLSYKNYESDLKYEIGGNITFLDKPTMTKWAEPYTTGSATKIQNITVTEQDGEMAAFYGYETDGLLTQEDIDNTYAMLNNDTIFTYQNNWFWYEGQLKLVDRNGDGFLNEEDKTNIGSANPDFFYGINLNLMYKGFDLSLFIQGTYGNQLINGVNAWSQFPDEGDNNLSAVVLDAWTPEKQNTDVPRLVQGNGIMQNFFNDYLVEDASYLRLKNIQLGYTLPTNLLEKVGVKSLRLYVSGENLLTITKYSGFDPEVGSIQYNNTLQRNDPLSQGIDQANYPIAKRFIFGLNISF